MEIITNTSTNLSDYDPTSNNTSRRSGFSQTVTIPLVLTSTILVIIINFIICRIIIKKKEFHTSTFYLLFNMAISDCFIMVAAFLLIGNNYIASIQVWSSATLMVVCKITPSLNAVSLVSSTYTLAAISIERHYTLISKVRNRSLFKTRKRLTIVIAATWLIGLIMAIPMLFIATYTPKTPWMCNIINISLAFNVGYFMSLLVVAYIIPLIIMIIMYSKIIHFLTNNLMTNQNTPSPVYQNNRKRHTRIIAMLIIATVLFFLFCFPLFISFIIVALSGLDFAIYFSAITPRQVAILQAAFLITVIACIQNPIIYFSFMPAFRQAFPCYDLYRRNKINNWKFMSSNQITPDTVQSKDQLHSLSQTTPASG
ncbi:Neuropeptide SIFamide receptor [Trichoplax sp. H2]|nr:Neuropeptide SIFamide receptor [Trichoplax sp. H2]|eukprot:RDD37898.1 Neuropeptide SIFamide receptor [Trichoplax sp. H2]